ncbi:predicted protein [Naegleria gruberi]|uniref:Predicted protein n=1 Tax=Naegleria gruberi TaxID=5762 RepID=D2UYX9_NAEGR|nr:uncharacterized protein NAEGRDRAFT_61741 [Naegleria gruberi]EFC50049.1 predicted protein [Naegleria gruberi]|eukprot:XP_002682793.1 predicted protein [Naegleria gruberi strain NEG-M]
MCEANLQTWHFLRIGFVSKRIEKFAAMKALYLEVSNTFDHTKLGNSHSQRGNIKHQISEETNNLSKSSSSSYEDEEMEEETAELYEEPEFEETNSERKLLKQWTAHDCAVDILILTYPRTDIKYSYLSSSVSSIYNELEGTIFKPCITVFNNLPDMRKELEIAIPEHILNSGRFRILENQIASSIFTSHLLNAKKRNHANNFYDMLKMFVAVSDIDRNIFIWIKWNYCTEERHSFNN